MSQACDPRRQVGVNLNHVGGLVFAGGRLHYVKAAWRAGLEHRRYKRAETPGDTRAVLCAYDPRSGQHSELGDLSGGAGPDMYIARGARAADGTLCFGKICARPAGYFHVRLPEVTAAPASLCLRMWG